MPVHEAPEGEQVHHPKHYNSHPTARGRIRLIKGLSVFSTYLEVLCGGYSKKRTWVLSFCRKATRRKALLRLCALPEFGVKGWGFSSICCGIYVEFFARMDGRPCCGVRQL